MNPTLGKLLVFITLAAVCTHWDNVGLMLGQFTQIWDSIGWVLAVCHAVPSGILVDMAVAKDAHDP